MGYPTINSNAFGSNFTMPQGMARVPFDLLRVSMVTRNPAKAGSMAQEFQQSVNAPDFAGAAAFPQRMLFQQWKRAGGGMTRGPYEAPLGSAMSASAGMRPQVMTGGATLRTVRVPAQVPTYEMVMAARARGADWVPGPTYAPMPPGVTAETPRVRPLQQPILPPLDAYGMAVRRIEDEASLSKQADTARAVASVATLQAGIRRMVGF